MSNYCNKVAPALLYGRETGKTESEEGLSDPRGVAVVDSQRLSDIRDWPNKHQRTKMDTSATTISVPAHLHAALYGLTDITELPDEISSQLKNAIKPGLDDSAAELRYDLLRRISQWAQSSEGGDILKGKGLSELTRLILMGWEWLIRSM